MAGGFWGVTSWDRDSRGKAESILRACSAWGAKPAEKSCSFPPSEGFQSQAPCARAAQAADPAPSYTKYTMHAVLAANVQIKMLYYPSSYTYVTEALEVEIEEMVKPQLSREGQDLIDSVCPSCSVSLTQIFVRAEYSLPIFFFNLLTF